MIQVKICIFIFFYQLEILLYLNLSVYICEASLKDLNPGSYSPQALILVE